ncbi:MAG: glycerol kinase GlpK [Candidatus Pacebacteria bacterium]|nr:glycerol kinase GlpK [Candidatus Paceibacterota bacterium]
MREKVILAIDLGTTGNRVVAFNKKGKIVAKSYYKFSQIFPHSGWVEHNPLEILKTTIKALRKVIKIVGAENVVCIGITNQRETTILWDKDTGKPVYNAIVWQCRRTEKLCKQYKNYTKAIKQKTGLFLDPYFSVTKIKWIIENVPGIKGKIKRGKILFGTPDTWLLWNLTKEKCHLTEPSNASRTLLFNIKTLKFDDGLLKLFKISSSILPEVRASSSFFGCTDKRFTQKEIPITGVLGDQQASLFAHCGWEKNIIKATYGTGIFVMTNTLNKLYNLNTLLTTIAWQFENEINYALEGSIFMGGATIQWLKDNLKILKKVEESEDIAKSLPNNEGVYFVPAFQGLGAPWWDAKARGIIIGLTRKTTWKNIVRSALESMAYQVREVVEEMKKIQKKKFKVLRVDGQASINNFLMQFQADILNMEIERPKIIETTSLGVAGLAGISAGFWTKEEFRNLQKTEKIFRPSSLREKFEKFYQRWKEATKRSKKWTEE